MTQNDTQTRSSSSGHPRTGQDFLSQQRMAIDLISTARTSIVRCAYAGQVTARPDPESAQNKDRRRTRVETLAEQIKFMDRVRRLLEGVDQEGAIDKRVCTWIAEITASYPTLPGLLKNSLKALNRVYEAAADFLADEDEGGDAVALDAAIKSYIESTRGVPEQITELCDALWQDLDNGRQNDIQAAERSRSAIDETLARLEKIGKHVRLVSLNASVEASRAGEAGKGLAVIAVEFKSLAEEIQNLSATARRDIEQMNTSKD